MIRYIKTRPPDQQQALGAGHKQGTSYPYRNRCQAILLSAEGYSLQELEVLFQVKELSIYQWFNRFEAHGVAGLSNRSGQGRKPLLKLSNHVHVAAVASHIDQQAQRLKVAKAAIEKQLDCAWSESTLKRFLKKMVTAGNAIANG